MVDAIPPNLHHAVSCGIGLFICLIGLINAKFVVGDPVTVVHASSLNPVIVTFLMLFTCKRHEIKPAMWIVAALSGVLLVQL